MKSLIKKLIIFFLRNYILLSHTLLFLIFVGNGISDIESLIIVPLFLPVALLYEKIFGNFLCALPVFFIVWILAFYLDRLKNKLYYKWKEKRKALE